MFSECEQTQSSVPYLNLKNNYFYSMNAKCQMAYSYSSACQTIKYKNTIARIKMILRFCNENCHPLTTKIPHSCGIDF